MLMSSYYYHHIIVVKEFVKILYSSVSVSERQMAGGWIRSGNYALLFEYKIKILVIKLIFGYTIVTNQQIEILILCI